MAALFDLHAPAPGRLHAASQAPGAAARRAALLTGCGLAATAALALGDPAPMIDADAQLATLLRGMALIKAGIVALALVALLWRLGRPLPAPMATGYIVGAWALCAATALIWQLTWLVPAALIFHAAELGLLVLAWRDGGAARTVAAS